MFFAIVELSGVITLNSILINSPRETTKVKKKISLLLIKFSLTMIVLCTGWDAYYAFSFIFHLFSDGSLIYLFISIIYLIITLYESRILILFWKIRYYNSYEVKIKFIILQKKKKKDYEDA